MRLEIVTPDKKSFEGDVKGVVFNAPFGEIGVLPGHAPFFSLIKPGELKYDDNGTQKSLAVGSGFVEVTFQKVVVLTDMALESAEINEEKAKSALERAQSALKNTELTDEDRDKHIMIIEKSLAVLRVKNKHM